MPLDKKAVDGLLAILLIYLPTAAARQMLGDIYRSRASEQNEALNAGTRQLIDALQSRGPLTYESPRNR